MYDDNGHKQPLQGGVGVNQVYQGQKNSDNKGANVAVVALAVLVTAVLVATFFLDPLGLFNRQSSAQSEGNITPEGKTVATDEAGLESQGAIDSQQSINDATPLSITINSFDVEQFPNVAIYAQIAANSDGSPVKIDSSVLSVVEVDSTGAEHTCRVSSVNATSSNSTSYKIDYTSSLPTADGTSRTVRLATASESIYDGWAEKSYTPPVKEEAPQEQQADTNQSQGGDTTVVVVMPEGYTYPTNNAGTSPYTIVTAPVSDFILPESSTRVYSYAELSQLSKSELELARNEIFARHGRGFSTDYIREYFQSKSWYVERYSPSYFDTYVNDLNSIEKENVERIQSLE